MNSPPNLAVGYLLDERKKDLTREIPASFVPGMDYALPRFRALLLRFLQTAIIPQVGVAAFRRKPPCKKRFQVCGALPSRRYD